MDKKKAIIGILTALGITFGYVGVTKDIQCVVADVQININNGYVWCGSFEEATQYKKNLLENVDKLSKEQLSTYEAWISEDPNFKSEIKTDLIDKIKTDQNLTNFYQIHKELIKDKDYFDSLRFELSDKLTNNQYIDYDDESIYITVLKKKLEDSNLVLDFEPDQLTNDELVKKFNEIMKK